jgi:RNA recognition motif-containing protein
MNIYVGNLPYTMGDAELRQSFEEFGTVASASIVKDKFTGRSRGFGFVEMADADSGNRAIESMNGKNLAGRPLVVNEARPREERPRFDRGDRPQRQDRGDRGPRY